MSKSEITKSLPTSAEIRQAAEQIKTTAETLAQQIEPMAKAMAGLAEETRTVLGETQKASKDQAKAWGDHQTAAAEAIRDRWSKSVSQILEAKGKLSETITDTREATGELKKAAKAMTWRLWAALGMGVAITLVVLLSALRLSIPGDVYTNPKTGEIWVKVWERQASVRSNGEQS